MGNHILKAQVTLQSGLLAETIHFHPGLNLISGENGTLKTKLLQALKANPGQLSLPGTACSIQAVSPKRNAERRAYQKVVDEFRRNNTKIESLTNERSINDGAFENYPALGDLYCAVYQALCKDGGSQIDKMTTATQQFNTVIENIFPQYKLVAEWNSTSGGPSVQLLKNGTILVPLEGLSLGEQEILSLAANIDSSRNRYDVFMIDEPEVHLNWHLEERLFNFFDDLCNTDNKQMIVVTHSRIVFKQRFYEKTQFLSWNSNGKISISKEVTPEQRRRIAGDAIEIIKLGHFTRPTFFVEDDRSVEVVEALAKTLSKDISVTPCGNKANVRSIYSRSVDDGGWTKSFFIEDGDNEGSPWPSDPQFIHLDKYCIENYLLDPSVACKVSGCSQDEVITHILQSILTNKDIVFKRNKFFEFLVGHLTVEHLTPESLSKLDASEIIDTFVKRLGLSFHDYLERYIREAAYQKRLSDVLPGAIVSTIERCS